MTKLTNLQTEFLRHVRRASAYDGRAYLTEGRQVYSAPGPMCRGTAGAYVATVRSCEARGLVAIDRDAGTVELTPAGAAIVGGAQ